MRLRDALEIHAASKALYPHLGTVGLLLDFGANLKLLAPAVDVFEKARQAGHLAASLKHAERDANDNPVTEETPEGTRFAIADKNGMAVAMRALNEELEAAVERDLPELDGKLVKVKRAALEAPGALTPPDDLKAALVPLLGTVIEKE